MKRFLISILTAILMITCLSFAVCMRSDHDDEHHHSHLFEIEAASYGTCPYCGGNMQLNAWEVEPTCTQPGGAMIVCENLDYDDFITVAAYGHDFSDLKTYIEPTCTSAGTIIYECTRCSETKTSYPAALGHNYVSSVTKAATCEESGIRTYKCSRCSDSYTRKIEALGHDIEYEEKEATCTEDGYKNGTCTRCGEEFNETFPKLGHDLGEYKTLKEASCTEDGLKQAECQRCHELIDQAIPKLGHSFPEEWTRIKEPTFFAEGTEQRICGRCGEIEQRAIPKKSPVPLFAGGATVLLAAAASFFLLKKRRGKKVVKGDRDLGTPSFEDKTVVACTQNEKLIEELKDRHYLSVSTCEYEELDDSVEGADLLIIDVEDEEKLDAILSKKEDVLKDISLGLIMEKEIGKKLAKRLKKLVKDKEIVSYVSSDTSPYVTLVKLVLPVLKPNLKSDESLGNIGLIADALGIPGISSVIDVYVAGRDIKNTLEEGELGVSEKATIIGDIASILGLDTVASVAGLVDDVDSIKAALDEEAGANEVKSGAGGAKDIVDVISDVIGKD